MLGFGMARVVVLAVLATLVSARPVWSQASQLQASNARSARSFEQLEVLIGPGDKVTVIQVAGQESRGTVVEVTSSMLRIAVENAVKSLAENDVARVIARGGDPVNNGATKGAIVGIALAIVPAILLCANDDCGVGISALGIYAAMGAGIGAGIDGLMARERVIYQRPRGAASHVGPARSTARKGLSLSISF